MKPANDHAKAKREAARETDGTFGSQHHAELAGGTSALTGRHPASEANRNAMENLVGEIQSEYGGPMTLVLRELGYEPGLGLHELTDETGWHYGLDDEEGLWRSLQSIDVSDPSWHHGVAEAFTLDDGRAGWRIDIAAAARQLG